MSDYDILAWQTLRRPPLPGELPPDVPDVPLKALTCRNAIASLMALVTASKPIKKARLILSDLSCPGGTIPAQAVSTYLVGTVPAPEVGDVCDPLYPVDTFSVDKSAAIYLSIAIPKGIPKGNYLGLAILEADGKQVASKSVQVEVADVDLPDVHDWEFYLSIWMNPGAIARYYDVPIWSDEHFELMKPYVKDLAEHGQKSVIAPIVAKPWIEQTYTPYPSTVKWTRRGDDYEFDFSVFDKYVKLHQEFGIEKTIHCYSIVQGPREEGKSLITYTDAATGNQVEMMTDVCDAEYTKAWGAFFKAFRKHVTERGWMDKVYIAFDEKPSEVMEKMLNFIAKHAPDFKTALAANSRSDLFVGMNDLSLSTPFDERGIAEMAPPERSALGVAELLDPDNVCAATKKCPEKTITTYYVCCGPEFPNTFAHSPLIESRMMGFFAIQGGYDGFLRWAYNDWSEAPYEHIQWQAHITFPSADTYFVYPGENGPVTSLRWEQLREGIQDYELAMIASENMRSSEEMVDYEQAISLACRNVDGREKSTGDIEIARRLLIPIAEHQNE